MPTRYEHIPKHRLWQKREALNLKLNDMARHFGLGDRNGRETASRWETGEARPNIRQRALWISWLRDQLCYPTSDIETIWLDFVQDWGWDELTEDERRSLYGPTHAAPQSPRRLAAASAVGLDYCDLRLPVSHFVGREEEIRRIEEFLRAASLNADSAQTATIVGIRGMGGTGKTQLAYMVAQRLRRYFPMQIELQLRGTSHDPMDPKEALKAVVRIFAPEAELPTDLASLEKHYRAKLNGQRALVLADDARDELQVRPLMPPAGCGLLITTRSRFLPQGMTIDLGTLVPDESEKLLLAICPRIADKAPALAKLCGYLPLALRISACLLASSDTLNVANYLKRLEVSRLQHLRDPDLALPHHPADPQASVEASLELSYLLLDEPSQTVLCQLSVFQTSFNLKAARAVVKVPGQLQDILALLRRRSLLEWDEQSKQYDLHDLVRTFAARQLHNAREVHRRAADYFQARDALRAAHHLAAAGDYLDAATLATANSQAIIDRGDAVALRSLLGSLAGHKASLGTRPWADVKLACGEACELLGKGKRARKFYNQVLQKLRQEPDTVAVRKQKARAYRGIGASLEAEAPQAELAYVRHGLRELRGSDALEEALLHLREGSALLALGQFDQAIRVLEHSRVLLPIEADAWRAKILMSLGAAHCSKGDLAQGADCFREVRSICERSGSKWALAAVLQNLGAIAMLNGRWGEAKQTYTVTLDLAERMGDVERVTQVNLTLGFLTIRQKDHAAARRHLTSAIDAARHYDLREDLVAGLASLADLDLRRNDVRSAEAYLREAEAERAVLGSEDQLPELLRLQAQIALVRGALPEALERASKAVEKARELSLVLEEGTALRMLGAALLRSGKPEAIEALESSLNLLHDVDPYEAARTCYALARATRRSNPIRSQQLRFEAQTIVTSLRAGAGL